MGHFILQTVAFQLLFLMVYDLFLKKETFFNWNRFYLLTTSLLSIVLPFIKFTSLNALVSDNFVIQLPKVIIGSVESDKSNGAIEMLPELVIRNGFGFQWRYLLFLGMAIAGIIFIYKVFKVLTLIRDNTKQKVSDVILVTLLESNAAFSFFNYVFLGQWIKNEEKQSILDHELVHVRQKHSFDLVLFEILRIIFWFNPLIYMYQNRISMLHEYIADAEAIKQSPKKQYYEKLLSQTFNTQNISFTNTFFTQSLIKKRIVMLSKRKSKNFHLFKYALLIPMIFGMLVYTSCQEEDAFGKSELSLEQYSYTLKIPGKMNEEQQKIHNNYESFLISHPEYVAWKSIDQEKDEISYSIHPITEKTPNGFIKWEVSSTTRGNYTMYINSPTSTTEIQNDNDKFILNDYKYSEEVPFSVIDEVPTLDRCKELATNDEKRQCLSDFISEFVNLNFNTNIAKEQALVGKQRISVMFKIGKDGTIKDIMSRAPHPALEAEAKRVIGNLPQMTPGIHNGMAVDVPYSLPILFQVNE